MSKITRYVGFKIKMPYRIAHPQLMSYSVRIFNPRRNKYFLKELNISFSSSSSAELTSRKHPVLFDYESDIKESIFTYHIYYSRQEIHIRKGILFENANSVDTFALTASTAQTVKIEGAENHQAEIDQYIKKVNIKTIRRKPTAGEKAILQKIFTNPAKPLNLDFYIRENLFLGIQHFSDIAVTPMGEIHFPPDLYRSDFSKEDKVSQTLFVHEVAHVWQHQQGDLVALKGIICGISQVVSNPYFYSLGEKHQRGRLDSELGRVQHKTFPDYNLEQQATIIADYYYRIILGEAETYYSYNKQVNKKYGTKHYIAKLQGYVLAGKKLTTKELEQLW